MEVSQTSKLRNEYLAIRNRLSKADFISSSYKIIDNLKALLESDFKGANIILCFYPYASEPELLALYSFLLSTGKQLYFPKCQPERQLIFKQVLNLSDDFEKGFKAIMEPKDCLPTLENFDADIVVITPGLVFDINFNRIGYGMGYYDRFFAKHINLKKLAVAFDFQLLEEIPTSKHDIKVDYIVTDKRILKG